MYYQRQEGGAGEEVDMGQVADKEAAGYVEHAHEEGGEAAVTKIAAEVVHKDAAEPGVEQHFDGEGVDSVADGAEEPGEGMPEGEAGVCVQGQAEVDIRVPERRISGVEGGAEEILIGEVGGEGVVLQGKEERGYGKEGDEEEDGQQ